MKNTYFLIKKNLRLLIRSKSSAIIVILAPLMLILLLGFSYNSTQIGLNIGIYSPEFTGEINSFMSSLQEEDYKIIKYDNSEDCIEDIKLGFTHTCLILPPDFQIQDNSQKEVIFHVDQSKLNLVYLITDVINKKFNLKSQALSQELASGLLTKLSETRSKIEEKSGQIEQAKSNNQQAASQSSAIQTGLSALDLTVPTTNYSAADLGALTSDIEDQLDNVKSLVDSSELNSSEKAEINDEIDQLLEKVSGNDTNSLGEISALLSTLKNDIEVTKTKLVAAAAKISDTGTQLSSLATSLNDGIASLDSVNTMLSEIKQSLSEQKVTDPNIIASPLSIKVEKISAERSHLNYVFPSLIVLAIMFIALLLGTTLVMMEKHNQAYFRNFVIPVRKMTFVFSTYLTNSFIILIQITIILGFSLIFLKDIVAQLPLTVLILLVSSSVFTLIGMAIGYLFTSEDTGTLASISMGALFLFVSGTILPLESMPTAIRQVTQFNPFVLSEKLLREIFIFNSSFSAILGDLFLLIGYAVIIFVVILAIDKVASKHFLTKVTYRHRKHIKARKSKKIKLPFSK
ncbi:ABC transporter permease [Candidatus Woesearchaeota archaeon]|nr:ABC transporter permease [Candidatus Woesearchaeota archaeon]